jgi:serine/threonine protein kinase
MNDANDRPDEPPSPVMLALREYQAALDAGKRLDRKAFLGRFPDIADELNECLDGLDYLMAAAPGLSAPGANPAKPDSVLGDFRLVREIGRGGMGVVYEAVQISLDRRVALKVLPVAATFDARQLKRFENEARAAAGLHHTHIVPVFGVGCDRGVPYYAMQLIYGRPLSEIIEQLRKTPRHAPPTADTADCVAALTHQPTDSREFFRTVATIGVQAAEALEYAHQMGVVHRDVKPANLILDGRDHLWVTDFGLARIQTGPGSTPLGDVVGTLRYMSPEQAAGDPSIDPRGDVYSLGATLYELLALRPAFPSADRGEYLRQVIEDDPTPLRALNRAVPVELETIVLKAMAKAPADRYGTAQELADDLRRYLDDRPITARRPTRWERARKWGKRHPSALAVLVVALLLGVVGFAVSTALIARAHAHERKRAEEAEERLRLARRAVDDMLQFSEEELANAPHLRPLRQRLSEVTFDYYEELIELQQDNPAALAELSATRDRVARILADIAVLRGAGQIYLVCEPAVQDDLRLSPDQRNRVAEVKKRAEVSSQMIFRPNHRMTPAVRRDRIVAQARATEADLVTILSPDQMTRLKQISLQRQGLSAFHEPDVVSELKLTADQRDRIRTIEFNSMVRPPGSPPRQPQQTYRSAMRSVNTTVLAPDQRARWQKMVGEPFQDSRPAPPK